MSYDSSADVLKHREKIVLFVSKLTDQLIERAKIHDQSKLSDPEKELFDILTPKLKDLVYGTQEYKDSLSALGPALQHHYATNRHHPEYFENGIEDMNLVDILELFCDWMAASERTKNGDKSKSIDIGADRFGLSEQLVKIFKNTIKEIEK